MDEVRSKLLAGKKELNIEKNRLLPNAFTIIKVSGKRKKYTSIEEKRLMTMMLTKGSEVNLEEDKTSTVY